VTGRTRDGEPRDEVDAETVATGVTTGGMVRLALVSWRWREAWVGSGRVSAAVDGIEGQTGDALDRQDEQQQPPGGRPAEHIRYRRPRRQHAP